ncbi:MAG: hypothetical protein EA381_00915 [Planctomycetaceae bacterium]|nr:MAG: hypothetical protein EA381_00915 [Planctomycetaceae bacterium]
MIFLPLFIFWLRAPMQFCRPVRWALLGFALVICMSDAIDARAATTNATSPQRGSDAPSGLASGEVRAVRGIGPLGTSESPQGINFFPR